MRRIGSATLAVAMGLAPLAACHENPEAVSIGNKADMLSRDLEQRADNMDAMAATMANDSAAAAMRNAADGLDAAANNVQANADARIDTIR